MRVGVLRLEERDRVGAVVRWGPCGVARAGHHRARGPAGGAMLVGRGPACDLRADHRGSRRDGRLLEGQDLGDTFALRVGLVVACRSG